MEAHSITHFENENMFLEKWKVINPLFQKNAISKYLANSIKKGSKMFVGAKFNWLIISNLTVLNSFQQDQI